MKEAKLARQFASGGKLKRQRGNRLFGFLAYAAGYLAYDLRLENHNRSTNALAPTAEILFGC